MNATLNYIHTIWGIITLLLLVIAVINAIVGYTGKKNFGSTDRKIALFALIAVHVQFLIGLIVYFNSPIGLNALGQMKDAALRLTSLEHPLVSLIAIVLITIGWSKHKKQLESNSQFKTFAVFYGIGLLLILSRIPWNLLMDVMSNM